jgi:hypothetical protein
MSTQMLSTHARAHAKARTGTHARTHARAHTHAPALTHLTHAHAQSAGNAAQVHERAIVAVRGRVQVQEGVQGIHLSPGAGCVLPEEPGASGPARPGMHD